MISDLTFPADLVNAPMVLVEKHHVGPSHVVWEECDRLCWASKNLYNACLFLVRKHYFANRTFCTGSFIRKVKTPKTGGTEDKLVYRYVFSRTELYHRIKNTPEYRTLNHPDIHTAINTKILKETLRQVEQDCSNFFKAHVAYTKSPKSFSGRPRMPGYKRVGASGRGVCTVPLGALGFKTEKPKGSKGAGSRKVRQEAGEAEGVALTVPRSIVKVGMTGIRLPTKVTKDRCLELKIVPCSSGYDVLISYLTVSRNAWKTAKAQNKSKQVGRWHQQKVLNNRRSSPIKSPKNKTGAPAPPSLGPTRAVSPQRPVDPIPTTFEEKQANQYEKIKAMRAWLSANPEARMASGDLGVTNLIACTSNDPGVKPIVVDGCKIKAYNQYSNKQLSRIQQGLAARRMKGNSRDVLHGTSQPTLKPRKPLFLGRIIHRICLWQDISRQNEESRIGRLAREHYRGARTSKALRRRHQQRTRWLDNALHTVSRGVVTWCLEHHIQAFVLGYNAGWKTSCPMSKKNNQHFVQLSFWKLAQLLAYKMARAGILFLTSEESYTSRCSFLDREPVCKHIAYMGRRVHRGLFKSAKGIFIHADVNASLNIGRKVAGDAAYQKWFNVGSAVSGDAVAPVRVQYV